MKWGRWSKKAKTVKQFMDVSLALSLGKPLSMGTGSNQVLKFTSLPVLIGSVATSLPSPYPKGKIIWCHRCQHKHVFIYSETISTHCS